MTGAEDEKRPCGEASRLTDEEIAEGFVECEAWIRRTQRYCDREVFTMGRDGWPSVDPDQAIGLLDP